MTTEIETESFCKTKDAIKEVNRRYKGRKVSFYIVVRNNAPIVDENKQQTDKCFPLCLYAHIEVSKATALKYLNNLTLEGLEERGARIPVRVRHWDMGEHYSSARRFQTSIYVG